MRQRRDARLDGRALPRFLPQVQGTAARARASADARRRDVRRERNREHARISRERKRQKLEHLQEENDALRRKEQVLVDERNRLRMRLDEQERQNAGLRAYIQRHRHLLGDVAAAVLAPAPPPA